MDLISSYYDDNTDENVAAAAAGEGPGTTSFHKETLKCFCN